MYATVTCNSITKSLYYSIWHCFTHVANWFTYLIVLFGTHVHCCRY